MECGFSYDEVMTKPIATIAAIVNAARRRKRKHRNWVRQQQQRGKKGSVLTVISLEGELWQS